MPLGLITRNAKKLSLIWNTYLSRIAPASNQIDTITDAGGGSAGQCLITTLADHGLEGTPPIVVSGNSVGDYNVEHSVESVPSTTTLITNIAYTSDGTGGTWAPA